MYETVHGNLISLAEQGKFDIIVHGCNCFHTMGSGLAKQLAYKYPQVKHADMCSAYGNRIKLGFWTEATVEIKDVIFTVINAYTQYQTSRSKDVFEYEAFQKFLNNFTEYLENYDSLNNAKLNIGFPMIGSGLAGGDWNLISKMIEKFSERIDPYAIVTVVKWTS